MKDIVNKDVTNSAEESFFYQELVDTSIGYNGMNLAAPLQIHNTQTNRVFPKLTPIPLCQYCDICFGCAIRNELHQRSLQHLNVILSLSLTSFLDI